MWSVKTLHCSFFSLVILIIEAKRLIYSGGIINEIVRDRMKDRILTVSTTLLCFALARNLGQALIN